MQQHGFGMSTEKKFIQQPGFGMPMYQPGYPPQGYAQPGFTQQGYPQQGYVCLLVNKLVDKFQDF